MSKLNYSNFSASKSIGNSDQFNAPVSVLVDKNTDNLVVSEYNNHRIQTIDQNGKHVGFIANKSNQFHDPWGMTISEEGKLFVCDNKNNQIQYFGIRDRNYLGLFNVESNPRCVEISPSGDKLYISLKSNKIGEYGMEGELISYIGQGKGLKEDQLSWPIGIAFNSYGDLFVGESWNKRVSVFNIHNQQCFSTFKGKNEFVGNLNLTVDSFDRVIVSDCGKNQIEFFDEDWKSVSTFGSFGKELGRFNCPQGVYIDEKKGQLFVCDFSNDRIQILSNNCV